MIVFVLEVLDVEVEMDPCAEAEPDPVEEPERELLPLPSPGGDPPEVIGMRSSLGSGI